ncbi:MAG: type II secretion system protein GspL [Magnetococcus sp. YQC-9]
MKSKATWGVVTTPAFDRLSWARLLDREKLRFETGVSVIAGGERGVVAGISAVGMAVRKCELPFSRRDQIWAVLPQEAVDTLVRRFENPCYAMQWEPVETGASVLFAVCERAVMGGMVERLRESAIEPRGVVVAELGAWPMLEAAQLIGTHGAFLVVDGSASPWAVYAVAEGCVRELRLVAPATMALGDEAVLEELTWLIGDLSVKLTPSPENRMIFLGRNREFWRPMFEGRAIGPVEIPTLDALGQGIKQWEFLRPAGLALAAARGQPDRLLDFLHGAGERQWHGWLRPWRGAGVLALLFLLAWGGEEGWRFSQAKSRHDRLKAESEAIFREALPHIPVIVEPVSQLKQALGQLAGSAKEGDFPALGSWIGLIQTTVPADTRVKWLRLQYEPGELRLHGEVPSYNHLDKLRAALLPLAKGKETRMEEARIVPETKTVRFRLVLP